jgi:hypothetical protein
LVNPDLESIYQENVKRRQKTGVYNYKSFNTGPKGVIHDYKVYQANFRMNSLLVNIVQIQLIFEIKMQKLRIKKN